jgi:replication-associated recombination protein RarA
MPARSARPLTYRPTTPEQFLGNAREHARFLDKLLALHQADGEPLALLFLGPPGTGKTALTEYLLTRLGCAKFSRRSFSGADVGIDIVQGIASAFHLYAQDLFNPWRAVQVEEIDAMSNAAQVRMLKLMDDLPRHTVVVGSSNKPLKHFEERFSSRFTILPVEAVPAADIEALALAHWPQIPATTVRNVATLCCGCVRAALRELDEHWIAHAMA